ncbi:MAG: hypothetical protein QM299_00380 [Pseudomonadota bacterium]|jgi:hypothetical protein|nr:hypothetical protein [Pseudomonadota bacterium]HON37692.1 hypothetical protein [Deltaproteobacteria bacterium]HPX17164.1 hypothetical protein [Deltaproteobacteria bacterium]
MNTAVKGEMSPDRAGLEGPQVTQRYAPFEKAKKTPEESLRIGIKWRVMPFLLARRRPLL